MADFSRTAIAVLSADLLTNIVHAELVREAVAVVIAHRLAERGIALEAFGTLVVREAVGGLANASHGGGRVGKEPVDARALSSLIDDLAIGVGSAAGFSFAGVGAPVGDTAHGRGAVGVLLASDHAHAVQAHVAEEAVVVKAASHWKAMSHSKSESKFGSKVKF